MIKSFCLEFIWFLELESTLSLWRMARERRDKRWRKENLPIEKEEKINEQSYSKQTHAYLVQFIWMAVNTPNFAQDWTCKCNVFQILCNVQILLCNKLQKIPQTFWYTVFLLILICLSLYLCAVSMCCYLYQHLTQFHLTESKPIWAAILNKLLYYTEFNGETSLWTDALSFYTFNS